MFSRKFSFVHHACNYFNHLYFKLQDEHKAIGLPEVLLQDSKQSLVTRNIRVDLDASQDLAWHSQHTSEPKRGCDYIICDRYDIM